MKLWDIQTLIFKRDWPFLGKELVDMLHGSIMVDSKLGQGSVFSVSLSRSYEVFQSDKNVEFILNDSKTIPSIETQVEQKKNL